MFLFFYGFKFDSVIIDKFMFKVSKRYRRIIFISEYITKRMLEKGGERGAEK